MRAPGLAFRRIEGRPSVAVRRMSPRLELRRPLFGAVCARLKQVAPCDTNDGATDSHKAAVHRKAVARGDPRLWERARHERVRGSRPRAAGRPALHRFPHVLTGAEPAPRPGENRHLEPVAVAEFAP